MNFKVEAQDRPRPNKLNPNFNDSCVWPPGLGYPSCTIMRIMNDKHAMMMTTRTMTMVVIMMMILSSLSQSHQSPKSPDIRAERDMKTKVCCGGAGEISK